MVLLDCKCVFSERNVHSFSTELSWKWFVDCQVPYKYHHCYLPCWPWGNGLRRGFELTGGWLTRPRHVHSWLHFGPEEWGLGCEKTFSPSPWAVVSPGVPSDRRQLCAFLGYFSLSLGTSWPHSSIFRVVEFLPHSPITPWQRAVALGSTCWHSLSPRQEVASPPHQELWLSSFLLPFSTQCCLQNPQPNSPHPPQPPLLLSSSLPC